MAVDERYLNSKITDKIINSAIKVHRTIGPGFVEKVYERTLAHEFRKNRLKYARQKAIPVKYDNITIGEYRPDFFIEDEVIVELKAVGGIVDIHLAQMISYLKMVDKKVGLILNFAQRRLGIKRVIH